MPRVIAVTYVRMGSERLPGKMLREIADKPLLGHLIARMRRIPQIDGMVIATSIRPENDAIDRLCETEGVSCFRGSEEDVLGRVLGALERERADIGVIAYGDGPLIDPSVMNECMEEYLRDPTFDLIGNDMKATYPSGMYTETFSVKALRTAAEQTSDPAIREHATLFLRQHPDLFRIRNIEAAGPLKRPDIHLDVDTEQDLKVITTIARHFAPRSDFSLQEIIAFLDKHPHIATLNADVPRRWKQYQKK